MRSDMLLPLQEQLLRHHNLSWATSHTHGGGQAKTLRASGNLHWIRVPVNSAQLLSDVEKAALQWYGCPAPGYHACDIRNLFQSSSPGTSGILNDGALWTPPPPHCSHGPGVFHHDNFAGAASYVTGQTEPPRQIRQTEPP